MKKEITHYRHEAESGEQVPDDREGSYYVSVRDGERVGLLLGPFRAHREALDRVVFGRRLAEEADPFRAAFSAFGTCRMPVGYDKPGVLNDLAEATE